MEKNKFVLECCVDSVESALNAYNGGANRLELCGNLSIGGTTPSIYLFEEIRKICPIKIHVLIRPRFGDFLYSEYEKNIMKKEVELFRNAGAEGVVVGGLKEDGSIDMDLMKEFMNISKDMKVVLHRAFDVCKDPIDTLEKMISIGVDTILTSGQENNCLKGIKLIKELNEISSNRINIMPGSGMNSLNIMEFLKKTSVTSFHMSAKKILDSNMKYRKENVSMGIPSLSEYEIWRTNEEEVNKAYKILKEYFC